MQIGLIVPQQEIGSDPDVIVEYAKTAEDLGFRYLNIYDHVLGADRATRPDWGAAAYDLDDAFHEPFLIYAYLSAFVSLELVTGVIILPQRQTALVAKQATELDLLSRGRFRLGVGLGWNAVEYEALGESFRTRARRFEEQVHLLRRLWTERSVTFDGEFDRIDHAGILPLPIQQPIPIWMGGGTAAAVTERIGRLADGWICNTPPGPDLDAALESVRSSARASGRDPEEIGLQMLVRAGSELDANEILDGHTKCRELGATHVSFDPGRHGRSSAEHISFVRDLGALLGDRLAD